ncbi:molybdenum cofactor guanylyltransferase [Mariniblastus sp.]|nr:molybdenum cofactor guanylyltransferase [Mariniblastus sp.]
MQPPADDSFTPDPALPSLGAVVLCGGKSSRLGVDKQELVFAGKTFLETIVAALAPVTQKIVLVGNVDPDRHQLPDSVTVTQDKIDNKGPLEGIRVGLKSLANDCEYAFVSSCDVPLLTGAVVEFLFAQLDFRDAIVPTKGERRYGMTAIYRTRLHTAIAQRIEQNLLRVCDLADGFDVVNLDAETLRLVDPELDTLTNINSATDYFRLLERSGQRCPAELLRKLEDSSKGKRA